MLNLDSLLDFTSPATIEGQEQRRDGRSPRRKQGE